ncbi:MAG: S-layer protein [Bacilli bacterium]|nr:S-layer protein [Bacilli bacterium]
MDNEQRRKIKRKVAMISVLSLLLLQSMAYADGSTVAVTATSTSAAVDTQGTPSSVQDPNAPMLAEPKITKEQAVEKVKALFPIFKDAKADNVQLGGGNTYPVQNPNVWNINWNFSFGNNGYSVNSTVDSLTGELLNIYLNYPLDEDNVGYYPPKYSKEQAQQLAKEFIQKASPAVPLDDLQMTDQMRFSSQALFGPVRYDFYFNVKMNGVISPNESIMVSLNGNGEVTSYSRNKAAAAYPSAVPKISLQEATDQYEAGTELELQYIPVYQPYANVKDWFLGWAPQLSEDVSIDAQTGDFINSSGDTIHSNGAQFSEVPKQDKLFVPTTGNGEDQQLTAEQAEGLVKGVFEIPSERKLMSQNLNTYWNDMSQQMWNLYWTEQTPNTAFGGKQTNATVNAMTGQIMDFQGESYGPSWSKTEDKIDPAKVISHDAALEKALATVNLLYPNAAEELKLNVTDPTKVPNETNPTFSFQFQRFFNKMPVTGDVVSISLDASGKLIGYHCSRTADLEAKVKQLKANISKEDATKKYRIATMEQLQYKSIGGYYSNSAYLTPFIKLIYQRINKDIMKNGYIIDAADGEMRATYAGLSDQNLIHMPKDIDGHWAQKELETMVQYSLFTVDEAGQLNPDASISLGEWMNAIALAGNPQYAGQYTFNKNAANNTIGFKDITDKSPFYAASQMFIQMKWLDPKQTPMLQPEQILTREKLADLLVHMLKYAKIAAVLEDKLPLDFSDSAQITNKGAVTLVTKLGLLVGIDGAFKPQDKVSKAQAASVIMRLVYLQGKLDQKIM